MPELSTLAEMATLRRTAIATMANTTMTLPEMEKSLKAQGIVNPRTGKPYSRQTIRTDVHDARSTIGVVSPKISTRHVTRRGPLAETIGQWTYVKPQWNARVLLNVDTTWQDYVFLDALRRGTAAGFEISGPAFCQPAAQTIASYCFGKGISANLIESAISSDAGKQDKRTLNEAALSEANGKPTQNKRNAMKPAGKPSATGALQLMPKPKPAPNADSKLAWTDLQIKQFLRSNQAFLVNTTVDDYCLGNQFLIVNPDCTLSIASPETVTIEYSASDYRRVERVIIRTKMQMARVEDVYTKDKRTILTHYYDDRGTVVEEFENLIGRIPIVHLANDRSANEIYGRPIYSAGLPIMYRYDALINNILEGVTLLGTPIPMFINLDNPTETKTLNSTAIQYTDDQGNQQTEYQMRMDRQTGLFLGKGGDGKMLSTNVGFTKDSLDALRQLFLLWLNETHIPELIWGGAISSSKASTETQMPPFIQYINFRRLMLEGQGADPALGIEARGGLLELIDIWLRTYKLLNPDIVVGPVQIKWPEIDIYGDQTKYMWGALFGGMNKITDETLLGMSGYIDDPAAEVMKAAGKQARPPQFDDYEAKLRRARLEAAQASMEPANDNGAPWASDYIAPEIDYLYARNGAPYNDPSNAAVNTVAAHQHAEGEAAKGDPWSPFGPLWWFDQFGKNNG